jgi:hypothetical protein
MNDHLALPAHPLALDLQFTKRATRYERGDR